MASMEFGTEPPMTSKQNHNPNPSKVMYVTTTSSVTQRTRFLRVTRKSSIQLKTILWFLKRAPLVQTSSQAPAGPATAPTEAPTLVDLPFSTRSKANHVNMEEAEATKVVATARAATPSVTDKAEPPLNPNQPNQRRQPPKMTKGTLAGPTSFSTCLRGPRIPPATRPDTPELMWTTVPPAKSKAPISPIQPPGPQTQWQRGA